MIGFIKRYVKRMIYAMVAFLFLYYFGDFRINEVNVRDFLHSIVSPEELLNARVRVMGLFKTGVREMGQTLTGKASDLDQVSPSDQKKLLDVIKKSMNELDPKTIESNNKKIEDNVKKLTQDLK
jgi:hypothetical protein